MSRRNTNRRKREKDDLEDYRPPEQRQDEYEADARRESRDVTNSVVGGATVGGLPPTGPSTDGPGMTIVRTQPWQIASRGSVKSPLQRKLTVCTHVLNVPILDDTYWMAKAALLRDKIREFNVRGNGANYFATRPSLMLVNPEAGQTAYDVDAQVDIIIALARDYVNALTKLLPAIANIAMFGAFTRTEFMKDATFVFRWNRVNSQFQTLSGIPIPKWLMDYVIAHSKALTGTDFSGGEFMSIPHWAADERGWRAVSTSQSLDMPGRETDTNFGAPVADGYFSARMGLRYRGSDGGAMMGFYPFDPLAEPFATDVSASEANGIVAASGPGHNYITSMLWQMASYWQNYILKSSGKTGDEGELAYSHGQLQDLGDEFALTFKELGILDGSFDLNTFFTSVRKGVVATQDAAEFATKHMTFGAKRLGAWRMTGQNLRLFNAPAVVGGLADATTSVGPYAVKAAMIPWSDHRKAFAAMAKYPGIHWGSAYSTLHAREYIAADASSLFTMNPREYSEGVKTIIADGFASIDNMRYAGAVWTVDQAPVGLTRLAREYAAFESSNTDAWAPLPAVEMLGVVSDSFLKQYLNADGENPVFLIREELENGVYRPRQAFHPLINTDDPMQCGFAVIAHVRELSGDQASPWTVFASTSGMIADHGGNPESADPPIPARAAYSDTLLDNLIAAPVYIGAGIFQHPATWWFTEDLTFWVYANKLKRRAGVAGVDYDPPLLWTDLKAMNRIPFSPIVVPNPLPFGGAISNMMVASTDPVAASSMMPAIWSGNLTANDDLTELVDLVWGVEPDELTFGDNLGSLEAVLEWLWFANTRPMTLASDIGGLDLGDKSRTWVAALPKAQVFGYYDALTVEARDIVASNAQPRLPLVSAKAGSKIMSPRDPMPDLPTFKGSARTERSHGFNRSSGSSNRSSGPRAGGGRSGGGSSRRPPDTDRPVMPSTFSSPTPDMAPPLKPGSVADGTVSMETPSFGDDDKKKKGRR